MPAPIERPAKRVKVLPEPTPSTSKPQPRLFAPFRALGYISNHVPFALQVQSTKGALAGPHITIVSSLGRSWAMWEAGKMGLVFVGGSFRVFRNLLGKSGDRVANVDGVFFVLFLVRTGVFSSY